jgi:hypothetical protein
MSSIEKRIAKVDTEISVAKKTKKKQLAKAKIVRSYKGDPGTQEAIVKSTELGIEASEAQREVLLEEQDSEAGSKK